MLACSLDDDTELGLERCTTNEEAINVGLGDKITAVSSIGRTTVLDANLSGDFSGNVLGEPLAAVSVSILSDLRGGGLSSADGPDGFVGEDDGAPRVGGLLLDGIELSLEDIVGLSGLALLKSLTNAEDNLESGGEGTLDLDGDHLVGLTVLGATLRVSNDGPFEAEVLDLLS